MEQCSARPLKDLGTAYIFVINCIKKSFTWSIFFIVWHQSSFAAAEKLIRLGYEWHFRPVFRPLLLILHCVAAQSTVCTLLFSVRRICLTDVCFEYHCRITAEGNETFTPQWLQMKTAAVSKTLLRQPQWANGLKDSVEIQNHSFC